jgi:hypothetical protein
MPEFTVKEVRLPELHLPEVKRDEIVRALSGMHLPDVDLPSVERRSGLPRVDLKALPWRRRGLSGVDAGKLIAAALAAFRLVRPATPARWSPTRLSPIRRSRRDIVAVVRPTPRRSRRRVAIIAIAIAAAVWLLFRNASARARLNRLADDARQRFNAMRERPEDAVDLDSGEPVSVMASTVDSTMDHETVTAQRSVVAEAVVAGQPGPEITEQPTNLT